MGQKKIPKKYTNIQSRFADLSAALEKLGKVTRKQGPLDEKTSHLIQLAAAAAIRSEGAVHSHTRRAIEAGASTDEIYHAVILLTSTIGFPTVSAAITWVDDIVQNEDAG